MPKIEIEIDDELFSKLSSFCNEIGISEKSFFNIFVNKVAKNERIPFNISFEIENKLKNILDNYNFEKLSEFLINSDEIFVAIVFSFLKPKKKAEILRKVSAEKKNKILDIIAHSFYFPNSSVNSIIKSIEKDEFSNESENYSIEFNSFCENIFGMDSKKREELLKSLEEKNSDLAKKLEKNSFTLKDIINYTDQEVQKIIRETDQNIIVKALKNSDENIKNKFFNVVSKRVSKILKEDIEFTKVSQEEIEKAQNELFSIIEKLEASGMISNSNQNEIYV